MGALASLVAQGKALYAGVSSYSGEQFVAAAAAAKDAGVRIAIHQPYYNLIGRRIENDLLPRTAEAGAGVIAFCPLASGLLTDKYLDGDIPAGARGLLWPGQWVRANPKEKRGEILSGLNAVAKDRGQTLAQMALAWILRSEAVTSVALGASRVEQLESNVKALENAVFSDDELKRIDALTL